METVYGTVYGTLYTSVFGRLAPGLELTWQNLTIKTDFCSQFDIIRAGFRDAVVCSPLRGLGHGTAGPGEIHDCKEFCLSIGVWFASLTLSSADQLVSRLLAR